MKEFNQWLNNLGYSDCEIAKLSVDQLQMLEAEYITLKVEAILK